MTPSRPVLAAVVAAASLALTSAPALARGGAEPAPPPPPQTNAERWALCPEYAEVGWINQADGSTLSANVVPGAACLIVRSAPSGALTVHEVRLGAGWTARVKSSGSDSNRIDVEVNNASTGERHSFLIEPGKTIIR